MEIGQNFSIVTDDGLLYEPLAHWHHALIALSEHQGGGEYILPEYGMKFALRTNDLPVPDCDLTWGLEARGRTVQINPAGSAGDANVLSAVAEDRGSLGQFAVLRQGRLYPNRKGASQVRGSDFRHAFQKLPVNATGSFGGKRRDWYLVCDISEDIERTVRETAEFVERCARVRRKFADENS